MLMHTIQLWVLVNAMQSHFECISGGISHTVNKGINVADKYQLFVHKC